MKLVMFDIDGTLTDTYEMDSDWYVRALYDVFGFTGVNTDWSMYTDATDAGILDELCLERLGRLPTPEETLIFRSRFVDLLGSALATHTHEYRAIPGAQEFIELLRSREYAVALASGSWLKTARLKLRVAGLRLEALPSAYADDAHARSRIMHIAERRAAALAARPGFDTVFYIGDGVWDVRASRMQRYRFLGVGTGARADLLRKEGAAVVLPDYRDPEQWLELLEQE